MVVQNFITEKLTADKWPPEVLEKLRDTVIMCAAKEPNKYDSRDVDRIRDPNDDFLLRYVIEYMMPGEKIMNMVPNILESLAVRCSNTINDLRAEQFMQEMFECDALCGLERPGEPVFVYINMRGMRFPRYCYEYGRKFVVYLIKTVLPRLGNRQAHLVIDATGIAMSQVEFAVQLAYVVYKCYPGMLHEISVVDLPLLLKAGLYCLLAVFPPYLRRIIYIRTLPQLVEHIGKDKMPAFMGGTCKDIDYCTDYCPKDAKLLTVDGLAKTLGVELAQAKKLQQQLIEARKLTPRS